MDSCGTANLMKSPSPMPSGSGTSTVLCCLRAGKLEAAWKLIVVAAGWFCRHTAVPSPCRVSSFRPELTRYENVAGGCAASIKCCRFFPHSSDLKGVTTILYVCNLHHFMGEQVS